MITIADGYNVISEYCSLLTSDLLVLNYCITFDSYHADLIIGIFCQSFLKLRSGMRYGNPYLISSTFKHSTPGATISSVSFGC